MWLHQHPLEIPADHLRQKMQECPSSPLGRSIGRALLMGEPSLIYNDTREEGNTQAETWKPSTTIHWQLFVEVWHDASRALPKATGGGREAREPQPKRDFKEA